MDVDFDDFLTILTAAEVQLSNRFWSSSKLRELDSDALKLIDSILSYLVESDKLSFKII